jgi:L-noviosyl transferase
MRWFFVTAPGIGHLLPLVPLADAARSAGHDVLIGTTGPSLAMARQLGLPTAEMAKVNVAEVYHRLTLGTVADSSYRLDMGLARGWFDKGLEGRAQSSEERVLANTVKLFSTVGDLMVDDIISTAGDWSADVLVYTPFFAAGLLAARVVGIPAILHGIGLTYPTFTPALDAMSAAHRYGAVSNWPAPLVDIDLCPDSMRPAGFEAGLPMRYVPHASTDVLPEWVYEPSARPRVCLTLGSVLPAMGHGALLGALLGTLAEYVDVVVLLGGVQPSDCGVLPDNVWIYDWLPLGGLLQHCSAIVHHGGAGTTFTALAVGVPQVVLPHAADQPVNAQAVADRGVGLVVPIGSADGDRVRRCVDLVLGDSAIQRAKVEVRDEMAAMPLPAEVVDRLIPVLAMATTRR